MMQDHADSLRRGENAFLMQMLVDALIADHIQIKEGGPAGKYDDVAQRVSTAFSRDLRKQARDVFRQRFQEDLPAIAQGSYALEVAQAAECVDPVFSRRLQRRAEIHMLVHTLLGDWHVDDNATADERIEDAVCMARDHLYSIRLPQAEAEQMVRRFVEWIGRENLPDNNVA